MMIKHLKRRLSLLLLLIFGFFLTAEAQNCVVKGLLFDANTNEPLSFANIAVKETTLGTVSNFEGRYILTNIKAGKYKIQISYVGYKSEEREINLTNGQVLELDVALTMDAIMADEVIVTAQAIGQAAAINRQLSANTIMNVVSKDKIQSLPDQNAAESLGRLPGMAVIRDAGEGTKIVIRGLSPKFNSITVNGERIPSTDPEDRSVDLSMISPDMLEGIEVIKALTPDKDGDAIGGSVNFVVKKARKNWHGTGLIQTGYNGHERTFGQYKSSISVSNRLLDNKLGVIFGLNTQKADRSSDKLDGDYIFGSEGESGAIIKMRTLNLTDRLEKRYRYGGNLTLDYKLKNGSIMFSSILARTDRNEIRRRRRYRIESAYQEHESRTRQINTTMNTNSLSGMSDLKFVNIDWRVSYSRTSNKTPYSHRSRFRELGAYNGDLIDDQGPSYIPLGAKNNIDDTYFLEAYLDDESTRDKNYTSQVDFKFPFNLSKEISGYLKTGGKFRGNNRTRDFNRRVTLFGTIDKIAANNPGRWTLTRDGKIQMSNFIGDFDAGSFLDGQYDFGPGLNVGKINDFGKEFESQYVRDGTYDLEDYSAGEQIAASFVMAELNFSNKVTFIPGVRFETTKNNYKSIVGTPVNFGEYGNGIVEAKDTTGQRTYNNFLPMFQLRYKPTSWFDVRMATTKTLSRPNYFNLVPWERIRNSESTIERGNPDLKNTSAWNYDLYLSFYNKVGLLTIGGFYKELDNIDYIRSSRITSPGKYFGYTIIQPVNAQDVSTVKGIEVEIQTNFRFLPSPWNGILIGANFSIMDSKTYYPLFDIGRDPQTGFAYIIDTVRIGPMPGQAEKLANLSIGYERKKFSTRLSMVYQGESLAFVGTRKELDGYTDQLFRMDFVMQQKFGKGWRVYLNLNNLTNSADRSYLGNKKFPTAEEYFGMTADMGLKYNF